MSNPTNRERPDIAELYRRHGGLVRARIRRFLPEEEVDDVLQDVFVRAMDRLDGFRGDSSVSTWLYQITTRLCINRLRDGSRRRALWEQIAPTPWIRAVEGADQEARTLLRQIWADIDEESAMIAIYYHLDGLSRDEVAALVGLSSRTVGYRLEALRKLATEKAGA